MDAVKYFDERNRMCDTVPGCPDCPIYLVCDPTTVDEMKKSIAAVEKWSREHPPMTNGQKLLELIPDTVRSTKKEKTFNDALIGQLTGVPHIRLLITEDWWNAPYKEERDD